MVKECEDRVEIHLGLAVKRLSVTLVRVVLVEFMREKPDYKKSREELE